MPLLAVKMLESIKLGRANHVLIIFFYANKFISISFIIFFKNRAECELQVKGFPNAAYKKFKTEDEANSFIAAKRSQSSSVTPLTLTSASNTFASTVI